MGWLSLVSNPLVRYGLIALAFAVAIGVEEARISSLSHSLALEKLTAKNLQIRLDAQNIAIEALEKHRKELQVQADTASEKAKDNLTLAEKYASQLKVKATTCDAIAEEINAVHNPALIQLWRSK